MDTSTEIKALHWGTDGLEIINDPKRAREVYRSADMHVQHWGNDAKDSTVSTHGANDQVRYNPGRDYQFGGAKAIARMEWNGLVAAGLPLKSDLFRGEDGIDDLSMLYDIVDGDSRFCKSKGWDGAWLLDAAPNLFIAEETIRQTGEIEEEEMIGLSARSLIPSVTYNTWLDTYRYDRHARKLSGIAMPINMGSLTESTVPQSGTVQRVPVYKPLQWFGSGASWEFYELEYLAEARQNGAPDFDMVRERMSMAMLQHELTYNVCTLFGWPGQSITGVLDAPELNVASGNTVASTAPLGTGSDPVADLALFVDNFTAIRDNSVTVEKPDTIALGPAAWTYVNTTDYKTVDAGMNETLAQAIMRHLGPLGLRDLVEVPEMEYRVAQRDAWQNELGMPLALANRWAGGINQENVMLIFRKSPQTGRMVIGKPVGQRPQETVGDRTTVRVVQSLGSFDVRKPKSFRIVTNMGPV